MSIDTQCDIDMTMPKDLLDNFRGDTHTLLHRSSRYCGVTTAAKPSHHCRNCALESEWRFQPEVSARYTVVPFPPVTTRMWPPSYLSGGKLTITGLPRFDVSMT
jgi:hypothetical protein